jgi:hypothetical protein
VALPHVRARVQYPEEARLKELVRRGTIGNAFVPVLCGSAFKNKGVQPLLDAVVAYLPSPLDLEDVKARPRRRGLIGFDPNPIKCLRISYSARCAPGAPAGAPEARGARPGLRGGQPGRGHDAAGEGQRALLGAGVQDHGRPVRRLADLPAHLQARRPAAAPGLPKP